MAGDGLILMDLMVWFQSKRLEFFWGAWSPCSKCVCKKWWSHAL